ncbi:hypothetical protein BD779DRAFT_1472320 [Infundibulicybe gibba]|nr:hypothetical protein BD779DRAFT_1472320 [Infundibulicybe gibba]
MSAQKYFKVVGYDRKTVEKEMRVHAALKHENVLEFPASTSSWSLPRAVASLTGSGNPISWRQLWRALINSPLVDPHVSRKYNVDIDLDGHSHTTLRSDIFWI